MCQSEHVESRGSKPETLKGVWCVKNRLTGKGNKVKECRACLRHMALSSVR
jgi:hypothetical protein